MPSLLKALSSQVGRKLLTGLTGVALIVFIVVHLVGNLTLFGPPDAFNVYAYKLHSLGPLLWIAEIGLVAVFAIHSYIGLSIWWNRRKARPQKYHVYSSKGAPSRQSLSSKSMAFTGVVMLIFIVFHVRAFKYGETTMTSIPGVDYPVEDLKALVITSFLDPVMAFAYTFVMMLLGAHLGHGIWSAMTSLTLSNPQRSAAVYTAGTIIAALLSVGFLFIPLYIYFTGGQGALIQY